MELKDLIEGDIYYTEQKGYEKYIYKYKPKNNSLDSNSAFIDIKSQRYSHNINGCLMTRTLLRRAVDLEKQWLNACIKANKYVECPTIKENVLNSLEIW